MNFTTYRLNRNKEKIDIKEYDFEKFEMYSPTGWGWAFKYKKSKTIYFFGEWHFDEMLKRQKQNDEAVKNKLYCYARIDKNKSSSKQNTLRDEKGRPIKIYEQPKDCYTEIKHYRYLQNSDLIYKEAQKKNKLADWCDGWHI